MAGVDVVVDSDIVLVEMRPVQSARILLKSSFPRDRHRQHQGIQGRMVEPLADQSSGRQKNTRGGLVQFIEFAQDVRPSLDFHGAEST